MQTLELQDLGQDSTKILIRAEIYSRTLDKFHEMPKNISKSLMVQSQAQHQKDFVEYAIKASKCQQQLYRNKQGEDVETRNHFEKKIQQKDEKIVRNIKQIDKKRAKTASDFNKHLKQVGIRYHDEENKKRTSQKDQSSKLRLQLLQFFDKEKERKAKAEKDQISVSSCYQSAVQRINLLHRKNQQYAQAAKASLQSELNKNNKFTERIRRKSRIVAQKNQAKEIVYAQSLNILGQKHHYYIQKSAKNQDDYLSAWSKIGKTITDWRKKREQSTKRNLQKWRQGKHRVDEANSQIPQRCISLMDKTSKAQFRQTASSFRSTARSFQKSVQRNKTVIRENDERKRDNIMNIHLDMRLKNTSSNKITEAMHSMRQHARNTSYDFL